MIPRVILVRFGVRYKLNITLIWYIVMPIYYGGTVLLFSVKYDDIGRCQTKTQGRTWLNPVFGCTLSRKNSVGSGDVRLAYFYPWSKTFFFHMS